MDEEALLVWQDVLDALMAQRPNDASCPFCRHRPLLVEQVDFATRVSCPACKKYIMGRFGE